MSALPPEPWTPTASTRLAAVIGEPVRHSLSPTIHNAAFRSIDLDWIFVAYEVADGDVPQALVGMRALGIDGLSVTMPHKAAVAHEVDELTDEARALDAVNCVCREGRRLVGHNTDGSGFVASLADVGFNPADRRCVVVGAGGAARSVILALGRAGAADVCVLNRSADRARDAAGLVPGIGRTGGLDDIRGADLVVNATSVGMGAGEVGGPTPFPTDLLGAGQLVADLIVHPVDTPLLRSARERGATTLDGIGMLVHQAAMAFVLWTGVPAPLGVMQAAARSSLVRPGAITGAPG